MLLTGMGVMVQSSSDKKVFSALRLFLYYDHCSIIYITWGGLVVLIVVVEVDVVGVVAVVVLLVELLLLVVVLVCGPTNIQIY